MLVRWIVGMLGCGLLFWVAGYHTVDSILVRVADPQLGVVTLRPGDTIRWRSEGWATTRIGPHGLPGWRPSDAERRILLWGDSQVEGLTVNDPEKIHNQVIRLADRSGGRNLDCLPLGRSGSDAHHWISLTNAAEALWQPERHVWVVTDLDDLWVLADRQATASLKRFSADPSPAWVRWAAACRADALLAAGKRIAYDRQAGRLRRLDFGPGPRRAALAAGDAAAAVSLDEQTIQTVASAITDHGRHRRLAILYAPATPRIGDRVVIDHPDDAAFNALRRELGDAVAVVDLRAAFVELWQRQHRLARGFHHGMPGRGHLNAEGNRIVAEAVVQLADDTPVDGSPDHLRGWSAP